MSAPSISSFRQREPRRPLYVPVVTDPPLEDCWSLDVSARGLALVGLPDAHRRRFERGTPVRLTLTLPDTRAMIEALAEVAWCREGGRGLVMGLRFTDVSAKDRGQLARYLESHRFQVAVFGASIAQRERIEAALESDVSVYFSPDEAGLAQVLGRGAVSVLLMCSEHRHQVAALLQRVSSLGSTGIDRAEWVPRAIHLGPADAEPLIKAFNQGRVCHALAESADEVTIRAAVLEACREGEFQRELRRGALARARETPSDPRQSPGLMVSKSATMREVMEAVGIIAEHKVCVLLEGETGSGKGVLAQAIHQLSGRAQAPLVVQDCGTLTETLLESELFGHARGAFTGAHADHPGLFVAADGGTVFLDEIENTTPRFQAALLRVIETGEVRPVGGRSFRIVDVRLICASNRRLEEEVRVGRFRADLFYRLTAFPIRVPPLRERPDDILALAQHFLEAQLQALRRPRVELSEAARRALLAHDWPGNVRELRNVVERALLLTPRGEDIAEATLWSRQHKPSSAGPQALEERLAAFEQDLIRRSLQANGGMLGKAASALGVNRVTLGRKVRQHGLEAELTTRRGTPV